MPWPDPARRFEPAEDQELRDELRDLLGMSAESRTFFPSEPTPELVALADKLRAEARRRRNTDRARPFWTLLAAALPVALVLGGLSIWGHQQKLRADQLAAEMQRKEREAQVAEAARMELIRTRQALDEERQRQEGEAKAAKGAPRRERGLVIPVERGSAPLYPETQTVKNRP